MVKLFTQRDDAIMTTRTDTSHIRIEVIKDAAGEVDKISNVMTIRTVSRGRHVINTHTGADRTVVTRCTVIRNAGVVEYGTLKGIGTDMTVCAILIIRRGRYMIKWLASTDHTVVAGRAATNNPGMIINARGKATRCVTNTTVFGGRHMVSRLERSCPISAISMTF